MPTPEKQLEIFERAFSGGLGSCRMTCSCGKTFFHDAPGYDWDRGEREDLRAKGGVSVEGSVGNIVFEGVHYVETCECWRARAKKIIGFIDSHAPQIAEYLNAMKKQRQAEAAKSPEVSV